MVGNGRRNLFEVSVFKIGEIRERDFARGGEGGGCLRFVFYLYITCLHLDY